MQNDLLGAVRSKYADVAKSGLSNADAGVAAVAQAFGYSAEELTSVPADANMGLSCGNPTAMASLRPGEVVLDLGSGGGLDVFLAAQKVGPQGRAIGVDMTPEMVDRARKNARAAGLDNVEFHLSTIDKIPLPDASVDCVLSNCVINLAPDKPSVFREMARVLKPGGRVAVSDIALKNDRALPPAIASSIAAYTGCIAGAIPMEQYRQGLLDAGFRQVAIVDSGADLGKMENVACCSSQEGPAGGCCSPVTIASAQKIPQPMQELADLQSHFDINQYAASVKVFAVKPE